MVSQSLADDKCCHCQMTGTQRVVGQCRGSNKVKKKSLQATINSDLVNASSLGPVQFISTIAEYLPQMKLVNLSTSMHRLAKLEVTGGLPVWGILTGAVTTVLKGMLQEDQRLPRALSNIVWSLATVQRWDAPLMHLAVPMAITHLHFFKPFELAMFLWGVAKLGAVDNMPENVTLLFLKAGVHAADTACNFEFRSLSMIAWAFATANIHHSRLFQCMAAQMCNTVQTANTGEIANVAWAFGKLRHRDQRLSAMLAEAAVLWVNEFKAQETANILWGIVRNGFFHEQLLVSMLRRSAQVELQPQQLSSILWCCARVRPEFPEVRTACLPLLPQCSRSLDALSPGDFAMRLQTVAKIFSSSGEPAGRELHTAMLGFFGAAVPCLLRLLREFSGQSLVTAAVSLETLGLGDLKDTRRFVLMGLEDEVQRRAKDMTPSQVISMLCVLMVSSGQSCAVACLGSRLVGTFGTLSQQELQELGKVYLASEQLPSSQMPTRAAIYRWCCSLCSGPSRGGGGQPSDAPRKSRQQTDGNLAKNGSPDVTEGPGGENPSVFLVKNTFIEVAGADAEMDRIRLDAKRFLSERPRRKVREASPQRQETETSTTSSSQSGKDCALGQPAQWSSETSTLPSTPEPNEKFSGPPLWSSEEASTAPQTPDACGKAGLGQPESNHFHMDTSDKSESHPPNSEAAANTSINDLVNTWVMDSLKDFQQRVALKHMERCTANGRRLPSVAASREACGPVGGTYPVLLGTSSLASEGSKEAAGRCIQKASSGPHIA